MTARSKAEELRRRLREYGRVGIAFSGGVDSSFLLRSAIDALGEENVVALHARSCLQKHEEQERAAAAQSVRIVPIEPLSWPEFVRNPPNRCYFCKQRIYQLLQEILTKEGIFFLLDGTNADDVEKGETGRPGLRAIAELAVQTPLADCGLRKAEIRELSREMQLATWNKPSSSCLATRIRVEIAITAERLARVAAMEQVLAEAGFFGCRARLLDDDLVCIQLQREDMARFCVPAMRQLICIRLQNNGDGKIVFDLDGR